MGFCFVFLSFKIQVLLLRSPKEKKIPLSLKKKKKNPLESAPHPFCSIRDMQGLKKK